MQILTNQPVDGKRGYSSDKLFINQSPNKAIISVNYILSTYFLFFLKGFLESNGLFQVSWLKTENVALEGNNDHLLSQRAELLITT